MGKNGFEGGDKISAGEHRSKVEAGSAVVSDQPKVTYECLSRKGAVLATVEAIHINAAKIILRPDGRKGETVRLKPVEQE